MISQLEPNFEQENLYEINFKINHSNLKGLEIKRTIWNIRQYYHCSGTIQKISNVQTQARLYGELNNVIFAYYDLTETFMKNNNVQIENVQPVEIINSKEETNGKAFIIKTANEFSTGKKSSGYEESSENINMRLKVEKKKDEGLVEKFRIMSRNNPYFRGILNMALGKLGINIDYSEKSTSLKSEPEQEKKIFEENPHERLIKFLTNENEFLKKKSDEDRNEIKNKDEELKELRNEMKELRNEIKKKDEELKEKDQIIHKQELENLKSLFKKNE